MGTDKKMKQFGTAAEADHRNNFLKYDLSADISFLITSYRRAAAIVLIVEFLVFCAWVFSTTWWFGFAAFFTWGAASLFVVRMIAVVLAIIFIKHPERIDTYAVVENAESRSAQLFRTIGLTPAYYPMFMYGMFIRVIHPCLIITVLMAEATLLFRFPYPRLLFINIGFGAVAIVQGYIAYHAWRVFGVILPRARVLDRKNAFQQ